MKKIFILIVVVLLIAGGSYYFLNQKKGFDMKRGQASLEKEELEIGNVVSVFIDSETENAVRIMICDNIDSCQSPQEGKSNFSGIVGTVKSTENNSINLELESGELKTITMSEETQIFKNRFNGRDRSSPPQGFKKQSI